MLGQCGRAVAGNVGIRGGYFDTPRLIGRIDKARCEKRAPEKHIVAFSAGEKAVDGLAAVRLYRQMAYALEAFARKLGLVSNARSFTLNLDPRDVKKSAGEHLENLTRIRFERQHVFLGDGGKVEHSRKASGEATVFIDSLLRERGFCIA
jgi:hypothetical protein